MVYFGTPTAGILLFFWDFFFVPLFDAAQPSVQYMPLWSAQQCLKTTAKNEQTNKTKKPNMVND